MSAQVRSQFSQAAGAQHNVVHRYSTKWEASQVQELSAEKKEIRRWQESVSARRTALTIGGEDKSTATPNPNLSVQQQANFNQYPPPFAPSSGPIAIQPWLTPQ